MGKLQPPHTSIYPLNSNATGSGIYLLAMCVIKHKDLGFIEQQQIAGHELCNGPSYIPSTIAL